MGPLVLPLIAAGSQLASSGINAASQASMNKKTRDFQIAMYNQQRQNSLSDWQMQNDYNHPSQQMARLRQAGLNPNLVYGNGATTQASPVRSTDSGSWNPQAPQFNLGAAANAGIGAYYDMQIKDANLDNLRAQNTVIMDEHALKQAQTAAVLASTGKTTIDTESATFDLMMKNLTKDYDLSYRQGMVKKQDADTRFTLDQNERAQAMQASTLATAAEGILRSRSERATSAAQRQSIYAQIENIKKDTTLKQLDIDLRRMGVQPNDPLWSRIVGRLLNNYAPSGNTPKAITSDINKRLPFKIFPD